MTEGGAERICIPDVAEKVGPLLDGTTVYTSD